MANNQELIPWILCNKDFLDIMVTDYQWIHLFYDKMKDFGVELQIEGEIFEGRGADSDENIALSKATSEAVERFVCTKNNISSLGVAGHTDDHLAARNSKLEFLERFVMWQQFNGTPLFNLVEKTILNLNDLKANIEIYEVKVESNISVILTIAHGLDQLNAFGLIIGLGSHFQPNIAKKKALIECQRNLTAFFDGKVTRLTHLEFQKIKNPTSNDQISLCLDIDYAKSILSKLSISPEAEVLKIPSLITTKLESNSLSLNNCPLVFYRTQLEEGSKPPTLEFLG